MFLAFTVLVAVSYCCCIKEALAKETHSCCAQKSTFNSQACHHKGQTCPRLVSLFSDESVTEKQPVVDYLSKIDPGNAIRYAKILQAK